MTLPDAQAGRGVGVVRKDSIGFVSRGSGSLVHEKRDVHSRTGRTGGT